MHSLGDRQLPQLSAVLNNCPVHALTPEIKNLVLALGGISHGDKVKYNAVTGGNYPAYELLKTTFAEYYGINPEEFNWQDFSRTLQHYNAWDVQHVLGPVLRKFMKVYVGSHDFTEGLAAADSKSVAAYVNSLTEIQDDYRYKTLSPDQVAMYIGFPLGFSVIYHKQDQEVGVFMNTSPGVQGVSPIEIYHSGEAEGGSGHFERTDGAHRSTTFADKEQKLLRFTNLLRDPLTVEAGENLLKRYIRANLTSEPNPEELADIEKSITQIQRCMPYITEELAKENGNLAASLASFILIEGTSGNKLTKDTEAFIANITRAMQGKANQGGALPSASMKPDGMFVPNSSPVVAASMKIHTGGTTTAAAAAAKPTSPVTKVSLNPAASAADRLKTTTTSASVGTGSKLNTAPGVTPASTTSPGVTEKAAGAATSAFTASSTLAIPKANVVEKRFIPHSQAGTSASGAQTPGSDQLMGTVLLQNKADPASAAVGPNTTTSASMGTGSMPMTPPVAAHVSTHPQPAALTSSTPTTSSATATLTTTQQTGSPQRAALTGKDTETASAFTLITEAQTAAVPAPAARSAPSASFALSSAISQFVQLTTKNAQDEVIKRHKSPSKPTNMQQNLQDMFTALIILYHRDEGKEFKPCDVKSEGEKQDLELAKKLQKEELDAYFKPRR